MSVTFFIARRLSLASEGRKLSPAVSVGIAAVALAVMVMACAIAIVGGFKREITAKVAGFNSHIMLTPMTGDQAAEVASANEPSNLMSLTPSLKAILESQPYITDYSLQAAVPSIFKTSNDFKGAYLKSLTGENNLDFVSTSMISGTVPDYSKPDSKDKIVMSQSIASDLGLKAGDKIDTYFITDKILVRRLTIEGIYNSHFDAYDKTFAYGSLPIVQEIGNARANEATSISISVDDFSKVEEYAAELSAALIEAYQSGLIYRLYNVTTARQAGAGYFHWLNMLDTNVIVVLTLMTIVAVITLISGMLILMVDKIRVIALLAALGARRRLISRIFIRLAAKIALIGLAIGDILAIGLLFAQDKTHFIPLDPDSYYIDFVPVSISFADLAILNVAVLAIVWLSLLLPSRFAGKVAPAKTLARE
ncbi:MAG: ABC transporter permease [Muribaculaceae bacterium]|nr:ABC transporter permease [Muribaculaceae bacterium]